MNKKMLILAIALFLLALPIVYAPATDLNYSRWSMDNADISGTIIKDSGNTIQRNATLRSGVTGAPALASGLGGQSVYLDGNDDFIVLDNMTSFLKSQGRGEWCMWFNSTGSLDDRAILMMFADAGTTDTSPAITLWLGGAEDGDLRFDNDNAGNRLTHVTTANNGAKHFVCYGSNLTNNSVYYDGSEVTDTLTNSLGSNLGYWFNRSTANFEWLTISSYRYNGGDTTAGLGNLQGAVDEVCYFNRSLTPAERNSLYNSGTGATCDTLVTAADTTPPIVTLINLTSEGGLGHIIFDNQTNAGYTSHKQAEPTNLPNNALNYDGIDMSGNVLLLHFDGNTTNDFSGSGNGGTIYNGVTSIPEGKISDGYFFNKTNNYINFTDKSAFSFTGASPTFTFSFWLNYNGSSTGSGSGGAVLSKAGGGGQYEYSVIAQATSGGNLLLNTWTSGGGTGPYSALSGGNAPHSADGWHHMVITADGTTAYGYVDGVEKWTSTANGQSMSDTNEDFLIGLGGSPRNNYFNGTLDEVAVFSGYKTAEQIKDMYNRGIGRHPSRTNDTTPTFFIKTDESATCAVIDKNSNLNWTDNYAGTTNNDSGAPATTHILTLNLSNETGRFGLHNFSVGCKDSTGNENKTSSSGMFLMNITDPVPPKVDLDKPDASALFQLGVNNTNIKFNWTSADNVDRNFTCNVTIDNVAEYGNSTYLNGTEGVFSKTITSVGTHTWNVSCFDRFNNLNSSQRSFSVITASNITLFLNGTNESRSYEFNTTLLDKDSGVEINITIMPTANWSLDFDYMINWTKGRGNTSILINISELNNTKFLNGNFSVNISEANNYVLIQQDNNTDLLKIGFKVRGYDDNSPRNAIFDFDRDNKTDIAIPGAIGYSYSEITQFLSGGVNYTSLNLSYSTAGSKTILINVSTDLPLRNLTIKINGFDVDANNVFSYTEPFNGTNPESKGINETLSYLVDTPLGVFDEFSNNVSGRWSTNPITIISYLTSGRLRFGTGVHVFLDYSDLSADFRNTTLVEGLWEDTTSCSFGAANIIVYITDGTNNIQIYSRTGCGSGVQFSNFTFRRKNEEGTSWNVLRNGSSIGDFNIASLDFTKQIKLRWEVDSTGDGSSEFVLDKLSFGGIWLNRSTNNGTYQSKGNFTSKVLNITKDNIVAATLTWTGYEPSGTNILGYISNTCNSATPTFQNVLKGVRTIFTTTGNVSCVRFALNSSDNITSPIVRKYTFSIEGASISSVSADFGSDGDEDWEWANVFNSSNSPKTINGSLDDLTNYISSNCQNVPTCLVPVSIITNSSGIVEINTLTLTQRLESIVNTSAEINIINRTILERLNIWNYSMFLGGSKGTINVYDLDVEFKGSKNITLFAHSYENSSNLLGTANISIQVYYSKFNVTFPKNIIAYNIFAPSRNASNLTPFGQNNLTPIYNVTTYALDKPIDIYVRFNETPNKCFNITYSNSSIKADGFKLNISNQLILRNISKEPYPRFAENQTINITMNSTEHNSTLLGNLDLVAGNISVRNATTPFYLLNLGIDYNVSYPKGNLTLINSTFNITNLFVSYNYTIILRSKGIWTFVDLSNCTSRFYIAPVRFRAYCTGCVT